MQWIILALVIAVIVWLIIKRTSENKTYNEIIKRKNNVKNAWGHIEAQLQRRFDLVPSLVETIKGFTNHERQMLEKMTSVIDEFANAHTNKEKLELDAQLNAQLKAIYAMVENYPNLKSDAHFLKMQSALAEIEEDISYARQFYNDAVTLYNNAIMTHPGNIIAAKYNFKEESVFDAVKEADYAPKIDFAEKPKPKYTQCPVCGATVKNDNINCEYCGTSLI